MPGSAYLDFAASTPMRPAAIEAMAPFHADIAANPTGSHRAAQRAKMALEQARETVAQILGRRPDEIVFTGGGSEGDNLALKGAAWAARARDASLDRVVVSAIEHKAVLCAADRLEREGYRVTRVPATLAGTVDLAALEQALDERTAVVSVMLVNNETGIVQPFAEVAALVRERAPHARLHTDAVQAPQWIDPGEAAAAADLVSLSGHKFGGPKGVGVLVVRRRTDLIPLVEGGGHEWGLRAGTQNVSGIVAFATALAVTHEERAVELACIVALRDRLEAGLRDSVPAMCVNGDPKRRVEGLIHASIPSVEAEALLVALDENDVYAAAGSSCSSGATEPSHVLAAMGIPRDQALSSIRLSLGWASTDADVARALEVVPVCVERLTRGVGRSA